MRYEYRPLGLWTNVVTRDRQSGRFRAPWSSTLELIGAETGKLGATLVVIQVDATEARIRRDGMLRANTKVDFPGVRVSFESIHGPLVYATDTFDDWQANVRAIALSLNALRAVDRYGVSKRGEQYTGWAQLPAGPSASTAREEAQKLIDTYGSLTAALKATHPDLGGSAEDFHRVQNARAVLSTPNTEENQ